MNEYDEIMAKANLSQVIDFIKNGDIGEIDPHIYHEKDSFNSWNKIEELIKSKLNQEETENIMDEINNCVFRIENISFKNGVKVGAKLMRDLLQL
jgi:hypothetical protein